MKWVLWAILCAGTSLFGLEYQDFHSFQGKLSRSTLEAKIEQYLLKDPEIQSYFALTDDALVFFASPEAKKEGKEEYRLHLAPKDSLFPHQTKGTLTGAKIAIDPGHFGGWYARLEQRYVSLSYLDENEHLRLIQSDEGTLAFLVACHLKNRLEAKGAEVLLTREGIGRGAYAEDFFSWLRANPTLMDEGISLSQLFRKHYNPLDLQARAEKINFFRPDLTVIIHLNAHDSKDRENSRFTKQTDKNYDMVFLPGSFCKGELADQKSRIEFLRLLVTKDVEQSEKLCKLVVKQFAARLGVPHVNEEDGASYLQNVCLKRDEGVYARNLCLTRLVHSPVCYGESLIQNHLPEALRLSHKDTEIEGIPCSSRLKEIGDSYYGAIVEYFEKTCD